ncbi:MAG: hypothetical protein JRH06_04185 [Deltaproteobacteria bacterium]|nr:hypothetical protein [Deltaproteobacteria bacterium]MBW2136738.1 hypothetical protein [Deltaproteobacteria bacterium]
MIITTEEGRSYNTETDLTAAERHILQKLFLWEAFATGVREFREKAREALLKGWDNSGPIKESTALKDIVCDLEKKVARRIKKKKADAH